MSARSILLSAAMAITATAASVASTNYYKDVLPILQSRCQECPKEPILLPKGTRIECTAHFDNSPNNPANPDAAHEVKWGDQSWQEMMIGWFDVAIDIGQKPVDICRKKKVNASDD